MPPESLQLPPLLEIIPSSINYKRRHKTAWPLLSKPHCRDLGVSIPSLCLALCPEGQGSASGF